MFVNLGAKLQKKTFLRKKIGKKVSFFYILQSKVIKMTICGRP